MDGSVIPLDVYLIIAVYMDWNTIREFSSVNKFTREICIKEKEKRINSKYPFGEPNALIKVITDDINLNSISVLIGDEDYRREIKIKNFNSSSYWVKHFLTEWFIYHLPKESWILTSRITKATIRFLNRANQPDRLTMNLTGDFQCYIFKISSEGTYQLEKIM